MSRPRFHAPSRARAAAFMVAIAAGGCLALLSAPPAGASTAGPTSTTVAAAPVAATTTSPVRLLSLNQPVAASSSGGCCPARNAVDGRSDTRWASAAGSDPQWISVDLGQRSTVSRVRLEWDLSCATAYQVQTSNDASTWTALFSTGTGDGGVDDLTLSGTGRYVRVYGTHRCRTSSSKGYSLRELQVFGYPVPVTSPPAAPAGVRATPGCGSITVYWTEAADPNIASFRILRDGLTWATAPGTARMLTVNGLTQGQTYNLSVVAVDIAGDQSPPSNTFQLLLPFCDPVPTPPPTNLRAVTIGTTCVTLAWTAPVNSTVAVYRVYAGGIGQVAGSTTTTAEVCGLTPATSYTFWVAAFDAAGTPSASSNQLAITTAVA